MITIDTQPNVFNFINSSIKIIATMTGIVSGDVTKSLAYCLIDANTNAEVTPRFRFDPTEAVAFSLYFQQDISNLLFTPKPPVAIFTGSVDIPQMVRNLKVKLIEISFDSEACESEETSEVLSNAFVVINSAKSYENYYTEGTPSLILGSLKPTILKRHKGHPELIYTITNGPADVIIERYFYDKDNNELSNDSNTYSTTEYVTMFNVMPSSIAANVSKIGVSVRLSGIFNAIKYLIELLPECGKSCQVSYISRKGGYSTLSGKKTAISPSTSSETIYRNVTNDGLGGNMTANKVTYMELDITIPFIITKEADLRVYEDFIASGHYYISTVGPDGTRRNISYTATSFTLDALLGQVKCKMKPYLPVDQANYYL